MTAVLSAAGPSTGAAAAPARRASRLFPAVLAAVLVLLAGFIGLFLLANFLYAGPHRMLDLLGEAEARRSILLSLWTSALATALAMLAGVPAAYALSRRRPRGAAALDILLDLPIVLPPLVAGFSLLLLFALADRWLGRGTLGAAGLDLRFTRAGIVLAQFVIAAPFAVRVLRATFDDVPRRLELMSRSLGRSEASTFLRVSLPLARNGLVAGTVLVWARAIAEFGPILVFAGAVRGKTDVLPISIFLSFSNGEIERGVALSALLVLVGVAALALIRRFGGRLVV
ncbi:MAG: ABC transporter permease subunit [Candidatus Eisenbacteria bacterium]|nr:ABC transporter permease subunit [Candidatus Eisenbacteria bacterium]